MCLAMCLFFEETEPSVLINCVLKKKRVHALNDENNLCKHSIFCREGVKASRLPELPRASVLG